MSQKYGSLNQIESLISIQSFIHENGLNKVKLLIEQSQLLSIKSNKNHWVDYELGYAANELL